MVIVIMVWFPNHHYHNHCLVLCDGEDVTFLNQQGNSRVGTPITLTTEVKDERAKLWLLGSPFFRVAPSLPLLFLPLLLSPLFPSCSPHHWL